MSLINFSDLLPDIAGTARWKQVDLNQQAMGLFPEGNVNRLNEPDYCNTWVHETVARNLRADFTYGGHMEMRDTLWRGHYHDPGKMRHLGTDFNVPAGTLVSVPVDCEVVRVLRDPDQGGGWGGCVFFRIEEPPVPKADYFILAHLAQDDLPNVGDVLRRRTVIGRVGKRTENGGWYEHLHGQCFSQRKFVDHYPELERMDGYGYTYPANQPDFPNFMCLL